HRGPLDVLPALIPAILLPLAAAIGWTAMTEPDPRWLPVLLVGPAVALDTATFLHRPSARPVALLLVSAGLGLSIAVTALDGSAFGEGLLLLTVSAGTLMVSSRAGDVVP